MAQVIYYRWGRGVVHLPGTTAQEVRDSTRIHRGLVMDILTHGLSPLAHDHTIDIGPEVGQPQAEAGHDVAAVEHHVTNVSQPTCASH